MTRIVVISGSVGRAIVSPGALLPAEKAFVGRQYEIRRMYAVQFADDWLIFTPRHGLVRPERPIDPRYGFDSIRRDPEFIAQLARQLADNRAESFDWIEVLAAREVATVLRSALDTHEDRIVAPVDGLPMGQRSLEIHRRVVAGRPFDLARGK